MNLRNRYFPTFFLALVTWIWERRILTPFSMQLRLGPGKHAFLGLFSSIGDRNLQNRHFPTYFHALVTWNIHIFRPSSMHWWHGFGIHAFLCPFLCIGDMQGSKTLQSPRTPSARTRSPQRARSPSTPSQGFNTFIPRILSRFARS